VGGGTWRGAAELAADVADAARPPPREIEEPPPGPALTAFERGERALQERFAFGGSAALPARGGGGGGGGAGAVAFAALKGYSTPTPAPAVSFSPLPRAPFEAGEAVRPSPREPPERESRGAVRSSARDYERAMEERATRVFLRGGPELAFTPASLLRGDKGPNAEDESDGGFWA
jgi:hypothetical protein